jgi:hypothetical protein
MNLGSAVWRGQGRISPRVSVPAPAEPTNLERNLLFSNPAGAVLAGTWSSRMQDAVMLFFTAVFFALAFLYVKACEKLR